MYVNAHCQLSSDLESETRHRVASELAEKAIQPARNVKIVHLTISPALSTSKHFFNKTTFCHRDPPLTESILSPETVHVYMYTYIYITYFNICHFTGRNDRVKRRATRNVSLRIIGFLLGSDCKESDSERKSNGKRSLPSFFSGAKKRAGYARYTKLSSLFVGERRSILLNIGFDGFKTRDHPFEQLQSSPREQQQAAQSQATLPKS